MAQGICFLHWSLGRSFWEPHPHPRQLGTLGEAPVLGATEGRQKRAAQQGPGVCTSVMDRCTSKTPWGSGSGWTARTARPSWTTSRRPLTPRCPQRACFCRGRWGAAAGISVLVRDAGWLGWGEDRLCAGGAHITSLHGAHCWWGWAVTGRLGDVSTSGSVCREQSSPFPHGGGGQPDRAPDCRGEAQPRAGGPAHAQVGTLYSPLPVGPWVWLGGQWGGPMGSQPSFLPPPSGLGTTTSQRAWKSTSWTCSATSLTGASPSTTCRGTFCGSSPPPVATRRCG